MTEVLVTLAIMAVLGAVTVPVLLGTVGRSRIDAGRESLEAVGEAVRLFRDAVGATPASLDQLVTPITGADADICGDSYHGGERNRWAGPYLDRALSPNGVPIAVGTVAPAFGVLNDPTGIDYLRIDLLQVLDEDASALDARIDDGDGSGAGALRWTGSGLITAHYLIPFRDC